MKGFDFFSLLVILHYWKNGRSSIVGYLNENFVTMGRGGIENPSMTIRSLLSQDDSEAFISIVLVLAY